jgi:hypothetical protein
MGIDEKREFLRVALGDPGKKMFSDILLNEALRLTDVIHILAAKRLLCNADITQMSDLALLAECLQDVSKDCKTNNVNR